MPELDGRAGLFVVEDLGVHDPGAVIERCVQEPVAATSGDAALVVVTAASGSPAAAVGDRGELLHIDVDQLTGPLALVAAHRSCGCAVTSVKASEASLAKDVLHGRRCETDLVRDVLGAPAALLSQPDHELANPSRRSVW